MNNHATIWTQEIGDSPLIAVALHHGHDLRAEIQALSHLPEDVRLREEDPYTGEWTSIAPTRFIVHRSRFEVDLNRPREKAVYKRPEDAWGLHVWEKIPDRNIIDRSLEEHDAFYTTLKDVLSAIERVHKRFVVFDLHSYNHRRAGQNEKEADPADNPQINLGTGSMKRTLWAPVVQSFMTTLSQCSYQGQPLDVRENIRFKGGYLSRWVHEHFPGSGCVLSIEIKKTFMDEWTGKINKDAFAELHKILGLTIEPVLSALKTIKQKKKNIGYNPSAGRPIRIGFAVNELHTEQPGYTTIRLAMTAKQMGHEVYLMGVGDLAYDADERIQAHAVTVPKRIYKNGASFLKDLLGDKAIRQRISVDDLDVLMLRNDPAQDAISRPWAAQAGILFGRIAMRKGVVVLNDPNGLAKATSKMYFQTFPAEIRPLTIITRNRDDIRAFAHDRGTVVLKPLTGSGGQSVFLVRPDDLPNINQMIDSVSRDGFVIAQEYLPAAEDGDMRLFVMNGEAFKYRGKYCAFRRIRKGGDMRSNLHAGGGLARGAVGPEALELVEIVRPKLIQDGMFLVGLDIVGNKLMEINVFSPGGLGSAQKFEGVNFAEGVVKALERKTQAMTYYCRQFDNVSMSIV
ncbi:MAG: glutathione synthetase [bacterium]